MKPDEWLHLNDQERLIFLLNRVALNEEFIAGLSGVVTLCVTMIATPEVRSELLAALTEEVLDIPQDSLKALSYWQVIGLLRGVSDIESGK